MHSFFDPWAWKMALKEARSSYKNMMVLIGSLTIAIAAIVSVNSVRDNLNNQINGETRALLGADVEVRASSLLPDSLFIDALEEVIDIEDEALEVSFASMAFSDRTNLSRLARIRAIKGQMPFYGDFITSPEQAQRAFYEGKGIVADTSLMIQLNVAVGDSILLGRKKFQILGAIRKLSGSNGSFSVFGPRILMPYSSLEETGLIVPGARVSYSHFYKMSNNPTEAALDTLRKDLREQLEPYRGRIDTYVSQRRQVGRTLDNVFNFLNLVGFGAILLGMIGVSVTISRFLKTKYRAIAVLRCIGASPRRAQLVYWIQTILFGFIGSIIGTLVGVLIQAFIPYLADSLTDSDILFALSYPAIFMGLLTGLMTAIIFAWSPMQVLGLISPIQAIRSDRSGVLQIPLKLRIQSFGFIVLLTYSLALILVREWDLAAYALIGLLSSISILLAIGMGLMNLAYRVRQMNIAYSIKQGIANLYRPNNQTLTTMITVGTGVLIMGVLTLSQQSLLSLLELDQNEDAPNLVFLDIQEDQRVQAQKVLMEYNAPLLQDVPLVTMRLQSINSKSVSVLREDSTFNGERWALGREYRSSYRDSLTESEKLIDGEWIAEASFMEQPVPVSAEIGVMQSLDVSIGDTLVWDVQGVPLASVITSSREVDWQQISPNFFMIFPKGVLDGAPQIRVMVSKADSPEKRALIQTAMVRAVPNASTLDVTALLDELSVLLNRISMVLQFMGALSVLVGLIVLAGAIRASQQARLTESLLLRTLGSKANTIRTILATEFFALSFLSVTSGSILALGASFVINIWFFKIEAFTGWSYLILGGALIVIGVVLTGNLGNRKLFKLPPLTLLRQIQFLS